MVAEMAKNAKKIKKALKIELAKRDMTVADLAKGLGVKRNSVHVAIQRGYKTGKVAEWLKENGILKQTA